MITYTWKISKLDCRPSVDSLTNVVTGVYWRYNGVNDNGTSNEIEGLTGVGQPNPEEFTDFDNLTLEIVSGWLESIYSKKVEGSEFTELETIQNGIATRIELIEHPKNILLDPPF
jgi:hypothetical protein